MIKEVFQSKKNSYYILLVVFFSLLFIVIINGTKTVHADENYSLTNANESKIYYSLDNPDEICEEVALNKNIKIGISGYKQNASGEYDEYEVILAAENSCSNGIYYDKNLSNIKETDNYESWTEFGRKGINNPINIDNVVVEKKATNEDMPDYDSRGRYSYFFIRNESASYDSSGFLKKDETLKNDESIFLEIDNLNINVSEISDLRVSFNYGYSSSDLKIHNTKSIAYYTYLTYMVNGKSKGKWYGPYEMEYSNLVNTYDIMTKGGNYGYNLLEFNIVSQNLLENLSTEIVDGKIEKIKIAPFEFLPRKKGIFRLYSLSITSYSDEYKDSKAYTSINSEPLTSYDNMSNAENLVRHNVVNNIVDLKTIRWGHNSETSDMNIYYSDGRGPIEVKDDNYFYGLPYVSSSMSKATIYSFLSHTTKTKDKSNVDYYAYDIPNSYAKDTISSEGNKKEGKIDKNTPLYIINTPKGLYDNDTGKASEVVDKTNKNHGIEAENYEFINNKDGYFLSGISCSTTVGASYGPELPYDGYISSEYFLYSNKFDIVGGLKLTKKDVLDAIRNENITGTDAIFKYYYSSYLVRKYGSQKIYESYAQVLPGDLVAHVGHVEMITGMPHIVCNELKDDKQVVITEFSINDSNKNCSKYGGINAKESYVLTTSGGGSSYVFRGGTDVVDQIDNVEDGDPEDTGIFISSDGKTVEFERYSANSGWDYTLNSNLTNLESIDDIYDNNNNILAAGFVNRKRTFAWLLYHDEGDYEGNINNYDEKCKDSRENCQEGLIKQKKSMYLPFRHIEMKKLHDKNVIETPVVKYIAVNSDGKTPRNDSERNNLLSTFLESKHKLKGTFLTNYMIREIKIEVNATIEGTRKNLIYIIAPEQTFSYSLYNDLDYSITDVNNEYKLSDVFKKIKDDNDNEVNIVVSLNMGPSIEEVKPEVFGKTVDKDDDGFFEVLKINYNVKVYHYVKNGDEYILNSTDYLSKESETELKLSELKDDNIPCSTYGIGSLSVSTSEPGPEASTATVKGPGPEASTATVKGSEVTKIYLFYNRSECKINYYQGNTKESSVQIGDSTCEYGKECNLIAYENLENATFPYGEKGWTFAGWSTTENGKKVVYENEASINLKEDLNLYAVGKRTINFVSGEQPTSILSAQVQYWNPYSTSNKYLKSIIVPEAQNIEGWKFIGYRANDVASSTVTISTTGEQKLGYKSYSEFNFRSIYKKNITVKYYANDGTDTMKDQTATIYYNSGYPENGNNNSGNYSKFTLNKNDYTNGDYIFAGWNTKANGSGTSYTNEEVITLTDDTNLYAQWVEIEFKINYYQGNGTSKEGYKLIKTVKCNRYENCILEEYKDLGKNFPQSDNGWNFAGWSTAKEGTNIDYEDGQEFIYSDVVDLNLYAVGSRTFNFYSGINPKEKISSSVQYWNPYSTSAQYSTTVSVPNGTPIDGWEFLGYRAKDNLTNEVQFDLTEVGKEIDVNPNELTAFDFRSKYSRNVTLEYNANGGSGIVEKQIESQIYSTGIGEGGSTSSVSFTLNNNSFERAGYTFSKWSVGSDGKEEYDAGSAYTINPGITDNPNITMYAQWNPNTYNIVYELNDGNLSTTCGEGANPETGTYGSNVLICNPTRDGYTFTGWTSTTIGENAKIGVISTLVTVNWNGSSTKYTYFKNLIESGTVTLVANWKVEAFEIDESTGYRVSDGLLVGKTPKVEVGSLDLELDDAYTVRINDKNGNAKTEGYLGTGDKVQIYLDNDLVVEYVVVIKGDVNGDGEISPIDYVKIKNHIMEIEDKMIVGDEYLSAANMNNDEEISPLDYVRVRKYILEHDNE